VDTDRQQRLGALRKPSAALVRNQSIALAYADLSQRWTQAELAALYGISQQRIGQIVAIYCPHVGACASKPPRKSGNNSEPTSE
jgi:hypothetical protein